jgi:hypothetical protein
LPYGTALAINTTARGANRQLTSELPSIFSTKGRPTPFIMRAVGNTFARKNNLRAEVFIKRQQMKVLGLEETGGSISRAPGAPILTPVNAKLNAYGNIPRGAMRRLLADPKRYFLGHVRGVFGIWERTHTPGSKSNAAHGLKLIAALRERARYRPRFGFGARVAARVNATFLPALSAGLAKAMATAVGR